MNRNLATNLVAAAVTVLVTASLALASDPPKMTPEQQAEMDAYMKAGTPGEPHQKLAAGVGTYAVKVKSWHEAGGQPMEEAGTATRKMTLGGRVLVEDFSSTMMGAPFTGQGMRGYDNVSQKHWSTWMDSMSTGMMLSEGTCDAKGTCTFTGSWNDPIKKGPITCRMVVRAAGPGTEVFEMHAPGKDGKEFQMMEITYTKK